jgi:hypothetical protein
MKKPLQNHGYAVSGGMALTFPSQTTFHPYGHLICTPISILAATSYLKIPDRAFECYPIRKKGNRASDFSQIQARFTQLHVRDMMLASHTLYEDFFSGKGKGQPLLMIQDIYPWIPADSYEILEAGGLILSAGADVPSAEDELIISPLSVLLRNAQSARSKASVIVTARNHTTCYMCGEGLFIFDPLPASLSEIPQDGLDEALMALYGAQDVEYSAIVMRLVEKAAGCGGACRKSGPP